MIKRAIGIVGVLITISLIALFNPIPQEQPSPSRWLKIDEQGKAISPWSGPWACVYDTKTQLLWETKTDNESIHDGYWTYSWYDKTQGIENQGDCYFEKERCDTQDLIERVNNEKTCGLDNWRLPSSKELLSLVSRDTKPGEPLIAKDFFPQTKRGDYWTNNSKQRLTGTFAYLREGAMAVNFVNGNLSKLPYRNASFVRLVNTKNAALKPLAAPQIHTVTMQSPSDKNSELH